MTHEELIANIDRKILLAEHTIYPIYMQAFRAAVKVHHEHISSSGDIYCYNCQQKYPCLTIQAVEKELDSAAI